jgi:glyoxylase-like metal-dependent hydrolase (beta-lactamase superfamily II)
MRRTIGFGPNAVTIEPAADGLWLIRGGFPRRISNVYMIEDAGGVTLFDSGFKAMAPALAKAAEPFGGIKRVVLGHAHEDHRGAAPRLGAPIWCHADERSYAEHENKPHTDYYDFSAIPSPLVRAGFRLALPWFDGGPCVIDRALSEGDEVAGFRVVSLPGHSPGQIGLWREADRLALTTDCFYTLNPMKITLPFGPPVCTHVAFDHDHERALASLVKLAGMEPAQAWPGHARPVIGDVGKQLRAAARKCDW